MRDSTTIVRERQSAIRRELDRRGILLKTIAMDAGMSLSTVASYFPNEGAQREPASIPVSAMFCLFDAIPDDLLSMLLPAGRMIVRVPEDVDFDDVERVCRSVLATKGEAHSIDSPAGRDISSCEAKALSEKVAALRAVA